MMGLLSTIRGKKDVPVIGSPAVGPIASKSKKLVIQEWPRLLEREPSLFINVWNASAARSTSIKATDNEDPADNKAFANLASTIQKFFQKLICEKISANLFVLRLFLAVKMGAAQANCPGQILENFLNFSVLTVITLQLDDELVRTTCEELGARHTDFISRGFNSNFWDIFLVCMAEAIDDTLSSYMEDEGKRSEMILAYQRVFNKVVHHMRTGYNERRREKLKSNGRTEIDYQLKHAE
ncbi:unnamed protein product [Cylicostephanus goldi]|uniref:Globin domain-containing protein n=1 Tax=Cylicostephanus goldi TaxID=71465 RepID=A0A3P7M052_CYLGO|nr:unnamed protein product [Cylicostephanus goldi]